MKKIFVVLLVCLFLTGCENSVSQKEYDAVVKENEELKNIISEEDAEPEKESVETQETSDEIETIDIFEWNYDENNHFFVGIQKNLETEELSATMVGTYDEENKGLMQFDFAYYSCLFIPSGIDVYAAFTVGEETYMWGMNDGKVIINSMELEEELSYPEEYSEKTHSMTEDMRGFYEKYFINEEETFSDNYSAK